MAFTLAEAVIKIFIPREEVRGELGGVEEEARRSAGRVEQSFNRALSPKRLLGGLEQSGRGVRRSLLEISSALSGTAAIASIFTRGNEQLTKNLQATSLALSGAGTAARALGGVLRLLLSHPILLVVTALAALIFGSGQLKRAWALLREAAIREWMKIRDITLEVVSATKEVIAGYIEMVSNFARLRFDAATQGMNRMDAGLNRLKAVAPDVRDAAIDLGERGLKFLKNLFTDVGKSADDALAKALKFHEVNAEINRLGLEEQIADLERIRRAVAKTAEQRLDIELRIFRLREQLHKQNIDRFVATELGAALQIGKALMGAADEGARALARMPIEKRRLIDPEGAAEAQAIVDRVLESEKARLQTSIRVADIMRELGQATLEEVIAARQILLADESLKLTAEERIQLEKEIRDLRKAQAEENVRLVDLQRELGRATIEQAITARETLLADQRLKLTALERLAVEKELRDLRKQQAADVAARDPLAGLRAAIDETRQASTNWKQVWTNAIQGATSSVEGFFSSVQKGSKTVMQAAQDAVTGILDAVLAELNKLAAAKIIQWILGGVPLGGGGLIAGGGLFGLASGGFLKGLVVAAQRGLVAKGPTLAALAETPGLNELVLPLPKGLRPQDLASMMQRVGQAPSMTEGDVNITYSGDMAFASAQDIRSHARIVADAVRMARRMNHPVIRGGEA